MVAAVKFQGFVEAMAEKKHDLGADTFYIELLNSGPDAGTDFVETDLPADLGTQGGYTSGGVSAGVATSSSQSGGIYKLTIADKVITASGATIGPFRYVVLLNNSASNKDLITYYDYGSSITLQDGESFTVDFDGTNGVLTNQ